MAARKRVEDDEPRASWKGQLVLDLITVPVAAINVAARGGEGEIRFHQLHAACGSRIRHEKVCPIHGEVSADEVVSGYEFEPDRYVEILNEERARLRASGDQVLTLDRFVDPQDIDPLDFDGRAYYLLPDGEDAVEPFIVLRTAIERRGSYGIGEILLAGREQLVVVRPYRGLLAMQMLHYRHHRRDPARWGDELAHATPPPADVAVAEELVEALSDGAFVLEQYEDVYEKKLRALIEAKLAGEEIVAAPQAEEQPRAKSFSDALRRSVDRAHLSPSRTARSTAVPREKR